MERLMRAEIRAIAQRLSTILDAGTVIVLGDRVMAEQYTHEARTRPPERKPHVPRADYSPR